ncbi:hypothetical protein D3C84_729360 [compost metagenome]
MAAHVNAAGQAPFAGREPHRDRSAVGRKRWSFHGTDGQSQTEQRSEPSGKALAHGDRRPTDQRYPVGEPGTEAIGNEPGGYQGECVGPGKRGKNQAHFDLVQAQILGHERCRNRDVDPVDIVDDRRNQQQREHEPTPTRRQSLRQHGVPGAGNRRRCRGLGGVGIRHE